MGRIKDKAQAERVHFKRRLRERYGLHINRHTYWGMVDLIKSMGSEFVYRQSKTRSVHRFYWKVKKANRHRLTVPCHNGYVCILAIYDNKRGELITALPHNLTEDDIRSYVGD